MLCGYLLNYLLTNNTELAGSICKHQDIKFDEIKLKQQQYIIHRIKYNKPKMLKVNMQ